MTKDSGPSSGPSYFNLTNQAWETWIVSIMFSISVFFLGGGGGGGKWPAVAITLAGKRCEIRRMVMKTWGVLYFGIKYKEGGGG